MTLYNDDGSIWYQFSLSPDYTGKDLTDRQRDFKPYSIPNVMATLVILRVSAESEHWFKVEVNEESGLVKYISKRDRMWSTTTYAFWLAESGRITFREAHLRKQPGGEVIDDSSAGPLEDAFVKKIQGDWVFVQGARKGQESIQGWMKWKGGRQVLVGWMLNLWEIP